MVVVLEVMNTTIVVMVATVTQILATCTIVIVVTMDIGSVMEDDAIEANVQFKRT